MSFVETPETHYAKTIDGVHIAYQVLGDGPLDLVFVPPWVSDVEIQWEEPRFARFLRGLGSFSRLITFDKRGTGLSDRVSDDRLPDMETRMDDVRAVLDQVGSARAALFGAFDGGHLRRVPEDPVLPLERHGPPVPRVAPDVRGAVRGVGRGHRPDRGADPRTRVLGAVNVRGVLTDILDHRGRGGAARPGDDRHARPDQRVLLDTAREVLGLAERVEDYGTVDLMTQRIAAHEKTAWMLTATARE